MTGKTELQEDSFDFSFDQFSVFFNGDHVFVGKREYPIGQCVVDVLNLDETLFLKIARRMLNFSYAVQRVLLEDTDEAAAEARDRLTEAWELVSALPVYRDLKIDWDSSKYLIQGFRSDEELWCQIRKADTKERNNFEELIRRIISVGEHLRLFCKQVRLMLDGYFESLSGRNADAYAEGYFKFCSDMCKLAEEDGTYFDQSFPVSVRFVPMLSPSGEGKAILAEEATFSELVYFLEVEFYRALAMGNAPRRCHNCGRYFLLTNGYDIRYCNSIAPGETEKTCRVVGAHRKEARKNQERNASRTPAEKGYDRTYNRLKQRKNRKKMSVDDWNMAVARAGDLLDQSRRGELTDDEVSRLLDAL